MTTTLITRAEAVAAQAGSNAIIRELIAALLDTEETLRHYCESYAMSEISTKGRYVWGELTAERDRLVAEVHRLRGRLSHYERLEDIGP
jgi:hypothetical protein